MSFYPPVCALVRSLTARFRTQYKKYYLINTLFTRRKAAKRQKKASATTTTSRSRLSFYALYVWMNSILNRTQAKAAASPHTSLPLHSSSSSFIHARYAMKRDVLLCCCVELDSYLVMFACMCFWYLVEAAAEKNWKRQRCKSKKKSIPKRCKTVHFFWFAAFMIHFHFGQNASFFFWSMYWLCMCAQSNLSNGKKEFYCIKKGAQCFTTFRQNAISPQFFSYPVSKFFLWSHQISA